MGTERETDQPLTGRLDLSQKEEREKRWVQKDRPAFNRETRSNTEGKGEGEEMGTERETDQPLTGRLDLTQKEKEREKRWVQKERQTSL